MGAETEFSSACSRNPTAEKRILQHSYVQDTFDQIRDDTTSLVVLYDSQSFVTRATRSTKVTAAESTYSREFEFDSQVLQHRRYQKAFRWLLKGSKKVSGAQGVDLEIALQDSQREPTRNVASDIEDAVLSNSLANDRQNVMVINAFHADRDRRLGTKPMISSESMLLWPSIELHLVGCYVGILAVVKEARLPAMEVSFEDSLTLRESFRRKLILEMLDICGSDTVPHPAIAVLSTVGLSNPSDPAVRQAVLQTKRRFLDSIGGVVPLW
jgi:hypothetical protein